MSERVTGPQRPAAPSRPGSGTALLTKAEKRAAAKAAKERAVAAAKRRRVMAIVGAAVAVVAVIGLVVWLSVRSDGPATDSTASSATGATATGAAPTAGATVAPTTAAFPPVPAGADPALSTKPVVKAGTGTVSKLAVTTLVEGKGAATQTGQQITVNYVGVTYADGKEFDASWNHSQAFTFALGGNVIPGWNQGLVGVKVGSRVQLDIPAALAYGDNPGGGQPAGALRFVVDVLAVS
ncbi:FKBP-type peptidyl-prolyl cis-trans isomerase [Dactylosporangium darangshiense]|uniref:FKBP-type peptidyl-prolyl cis-trans isomerase n=1 Tax=Dactylosporangium darangshiense TaxID=579108 RepID=UPI0031E643EE